MIHTGDLFEVGAYPFLDIWHGGSLPGLVAACDAILARVASLAGSSAATAESPAPAGAPEPAPPPPPGRNAFHNRAASATSSSICRSSATLIGPNCRA